MMNLQQARVVDPVLTNHVQGWKNAKYVGHMLFPRVPVPVRGGNVIEFDKAAFRKYSIRRAPGGAVAQIDFGYEGKPYKLVQDTVDAKLPREHIQDAAAVPHINLGMRATNVVMDIVTRALEIEQAEMAANPANYDNAHKLALAGAAVWTDPASDPIKDVEDAREAVRASTGLYPNTMLFGPKPLKAFKNHPKVLERFHGVSADAVTTQKIAALVDIPKVDVGAAVYAGADDAFNDVWGNCVVIAYVPDAPDGPEVPSYGYTYALDGNPFVEAPRWDGGTRSWLYGVTYERQPQLTGMTAGYLIQNAG